LFFFNNKTCSWNYKNQEKSWFHVSFLFLCTVGSGIRCFFTPRIQDPDPGWSNGRIGIWDKPSWIRNTALAVSNWKESCFMIWQFSNIQIVS
jgi:hypothetical protein